MLATILGILGVADWVTTQKVLERGGTELNPVAAILLDVGLLLPTKIGLAAIVIVLASRSQKSAHLIVVIGLYVIIVAWNIGVM